jgi:tRNA U54 and U55 pseudouridine synthase Pus10
MKKQLLGKHVVVSELKIVEKEFFEDMKANIENKAKSYCAIVWVQNEITDKDC